MPTKEEQNTAETETVQQSQPETGAAETTADIQENNENVKPEENPGDNELAKWKAMSRKNEKQAEANLKQVQQVQAELAQVRVDNARLIAKSTYPQVTDKVFEALYKGDGTPEDIADFAKSYAELNPIQPGSPLGVQPNGRVQVPEAEALRNVGRKAENPEGEFNPKPKRGDAYKRAMDRQNARRRNHNKQTK